MRNPSFRLATLCLLPTLAAAAPGPSVWTASSNTATSITGDLIVSPTKITFANHRSLTLAPAGTIDRFGADGQVVQASLYRVTPPADPTLRAGNRLCSTSPRPPVPVTYIVTWPIPKIAGMDTASIRLAAYSGAATPRSDTDPTLCGTYSYDISQ